MKRTLALLSALIFAGTAVSCSKGSSESKPVSAPSETSSAALCSFKTVSVGMADDFSELISLDNDLTSGKVLVFGKLPSGTYSGYVTDGNFSEFEEFIFSPDENETVLGACLLGFGKKAVLTCKNGFTEIHTFKSDGSEDKLIDCGKLLTPDEGSRLYKNGDGFIISDHNMNLFSVDAEGTAEPVDMKGLNVYGICGGENVTVLARGNDGYSCIAPVEGHALGEENECSSISSSAVAMCCGKGEYSYIAAFMDGLYGLKGTEWVKLSDFTELSYNAYSIFGLAEISENEFAVLRFTDNGTTLEVLSERDISELKEKTVVKIALWAPSAPTLSEVVSRYNSENSDGDHIVKIVSYNSDGNLTPEDAVRNLKLDIISGNAPDIITLPIPGIAPNDYYLDLYDFLENDPELKKEDFLPEYFEGYEVDGKLPYIAPAFCYDTKCAKAGIDGVRENWSYDDFMTAYSSMPDGMKLLDNEDRIYITTNFLSFITLSDFVDYKNVSCDFEAPDFIKMMKFFKENHIGINKEESEINYTGDVFSDPMAIRKGKALISNSNFEFYNYLMTVNGVFGEKPVFTGTPSLSGNGTVSTAAPMTFSILKNSSDPEGAWDFIKSNFTESYYKEICGWSAVPTVEKYFDIISEICLEPSQRKDPFMAASSSPNVYYTDAERTNSIPMDYFDNDELEECKRFMRNAARNQENSDEVLYDILYEELDNYFNSDSSAEDTAKMIQNRAEIYLSEQYG